MEVAIIVIGAVSAALGISGAIASICTCKRFFSEHTSSSEDTASATIINKQEQIKTNPDGTTIKKKNFQKVIVHRIDKDQLSAIQQTHETLNNKTANALAKGASVGLQSLTGKAASTSTAVTVIGEVADAAKTAIKDKNKEDQKQEDGITLKLEDTKPSAATVETIDLSEDEREEALINKNKADKKDLEDQGEPKAEVKIDVPHNNESKLGGDIHETGEA